MHTIAHINFLIHVNHLSPLPFLWVALVFGHKKSKPPFSIVLHWLHLVFLLIFYCQHCLIIWLFILHFQNVIWTIKITHYIHGLAYPPVSNYSQERLSKLAQTDLSCYFFSWLYDNSETSLNTVLILSHCIATFSYWKKPSPFSSPIATMLGLRWHKLATLHAPWS